MNKKELVDAVSVKTALSKKDTEATINAFIDVVTDALASHDKVSLVGFGTFEVRERAARTGRDPRTGKEMQISAASLPAFKAGAPLKEKVAKQK